MDSNWINGFKEKLDNHYTWPSLFMFKFIVPNGKEDEVKNLFPLHTSTEKSSSKGNYTSITIKMMMPSSDAVVEVYKKAASVEGLIAL
jgi:putative lipoic acid-binding regulatory protein